MSVELPAHSFLLFSIPSNGDFPAFDIFTGEPERTQIPAGFRD